VTLPFPSTPGSLPGADDITRAVLNNGVTILTRSNFNSPSVVVSGYSFAGALSDPDDRLGLANFCASALMRGTERHDFKEIYETIESIGASLGFDAGTHTVGFSGKALSEDLETILGLAAEAMCRPTFPDEQIERLRTRLLTSLALREQDTSDMATLAFDEIVYRNHPYRHPADGYPESVRAISREDLLTFHASHYGPSSLVIVVVGAVEAEKAVSLVTRAFGGWESPDQSGVPDLPALSPLEETIRRRVIIPGKSQSDIVLGVAGPSRMSPDYLPATLGNSVLGQFGMYGRIGEAVREEAGLAYYAYSSVSGGIGPGPWSAGAGVDPHNIEQAIELIRAEIARFVREPVGEDELEDTRSNFVGRLPLALESNSGMAGALLNLERYQLGLDYYRQYPDLIRAITPESALETARRYLDPQRLAIATAGPE
jgi:zinc protease